MQNCLILPVHGVNRMFSAERWKTFLDGIALPNQAALQFQRDIPSAQPLFLFCFLLWLLWLLLFLELFWLWLLHGLLPLPRLAFFYLQPLFLPALPLVLYPD